LISHEGILLLQTGFLIYAFFFYLFRDAFTPFLGCAGEFRVLRVQFNRATFSKAELAARELLRSAAPLHNPGTFNPFLSALGCTCLKLCPHISFYINLHFIATKRSVYSSI
jgi:hypothetical protein